MIGGIHLEPEILTFFVLKFKKTDVVSLTGFLCALDPPCHVPASSGPVSEGRLSTFVYP